MKSVSPMATSSQEALILPQTTSGTAARQFGEVGVIDADRSRRLVVMARYRNRMVHFYDEISDEELYGILSREVKDVEDLVAAITDWLRAHPDRVSSPA